MRDDRVIEPYFNVYHVCSESDWGMSETYTHGGAGGSYVWDPPLKDYADLGKLRFPEITVNRAETDRVLDLARSVFGDILTVRLKGLWWWSFGMTWPAIRLRGLEQLMLDMIDNPEGLHGLMAFLRDALLAKFDFLEREGLLSLNNDGAYVGSGGFGWTRELPQPDFDGKVRTTRHVGLRREPGDHRRLARHVRGVRVPVPAPADVALRPELLRLLRAGGRPLARDRESPEAAARLGLGVVQSSGHGREARRQVHLLLETQSRRPRRAVVRRRPHPPRHPQRSRDRERLPRRSDHERQPHHRPRPQPRDQLDPDRAGRGGGGVTDNQYLMQARVTGILVESGSILIVKQTLSSERAWSLPGGKVENGESLQDSMLREMEEETGLKTQIVRLLYLCEVPGVDPPVLHITFLLKRLSGDIRLPSNECEANPIYDVKMVPIDELPLYDFSHTFMHVVKNGFPDAGSYKGPKANIGL